MSNSIWITGVLCLVIGILIGVIIGRMKAAKATSVQNGKQAQQSEASSKLHQNVENHFYEMTRLASDLQQYSATFSKALEEHAGSLVTDPSLKRRLAVLSGSRSAEDVAEEEAASLSAPRDYADGSGTLSEGFGMKESETEKEGEKAQAERPRY